MHPTNQTVPAQRRTRKIIWADCVPDPEYKEFFGLTFESGRDRYRVDGWIPTKPKCPVYVVRESDGRAYVMPFEEMVDMRWVS
jgi:hypothetical protein